MRFAVAALAAAVAAATLLPGAPLGVGVALVAALVAVAVGDRRAWPLLLALAPALRDAGWLVAVDLAAAFVLAAVLLAGGETLAQLAAGLVAPLRRLPALPRLVALPMRFDAAGRPAFGVLVGGALVLPFGALFVSADTAFAQLLEDVLPAQELLPARLGAFVLAGFAAAGLYATARGGAAAPRGAPKQRLGRLETNIALGLLALLFLGFVLVQLTVLFGGHDHVLRTTGLTYAEYARHGFWELLAVAGLTLAVVVAARRWARPHPVLLAVLCGLCLVVVASSLRRLGVYEDAYGFTRLRISVAATDWWLAGLLVLALAPARFAPRAAVFWTAASLAAFTLANPDGRIARHNVERYGQTGRIDVDYLASLSADAAPALRRLPRPQRELALARIEARLAAPQPWSSWSVARR